MKPTLKYVAFALAASMLALPSLAHASRPAPSLAAPTKSKADKTKAPVAKELIDINSATLEQLVSLPAVGKKHAAKIIAGRPYKSTAELTSRKILSAADFAKIEKKITVKQ
ncbi:MAG: helix-hairpin-helix domain-containing protein [Vicinamibacteria bacterium]